MKKVLLFFIAVLLVSVAFSQVRTSRGTITPEDISAMSPEGIPDLEKLKEMGLSDEEIKQLIQMKLESSKRTKILPDTGFQLARDTMNTRIDSAFFSRMGSDSLMSRKDTSVHISLKANVYGKEYFRNTSIRFFDKANDVRVSDNYVLAAGDRVSISVWGYSDYNEVFTIDKEGAIQAPETGRIYLKGMKFKDARELLTKRFGAVLDLRNSRIDITVIYSRVITVNIVGDVFGPGSYTIPAVNTAFNALSLAGGPNDIGSVRKIYIKRGGKTIRTLDVYDFLLNPDGSQDFFLEDNDYIFVPPAGKIITVSGEVKRPHNYELLDKESLNSLLNYAGGLSSYAYSKLAYVKRVRDNRVAAIDVPLDSLIKNKKDFELFDGDSVLVRRISDAVENYVEVNGSVRIPGIYELKKGDRVSDLLSRAQGLLDEAYPGRAYVIRQKEDMTKKYIAINIANILQNKATEDNIELEKYDYIHVFSKKRFLDRDSVIVFGSVRMPGTYQYGDGMTLKDALYLAGGLSKEAAGNQISISRLAGFEPNSQDPKARIIIKMTEVGKDLSIDRKTEGFPLQPFDQIFVRKDPNFELQDNVVVSGEVKYPGTYTLVNKKENLVEIVERAGGLTEWAFPEGAKLYRAQDSIGFLFLNLQEALKNPKSSSNYIMKVGDTLFIPKINELVSIRGAIDYPDIGTIGQISTPFNKSKRAGYYIRNYGLGFAKLALRRKTYLREAGGFMHRTVSIGFLKIYPKPKAGSTIYVVYKPNKAKRDKKNSEPVNWNKLIENTTVKITGILTLWLLISQLAK